MGVWGTVEELGPLLTAPPEGTQRQRGHDRTYGEIRDGFDGARDACNKGIDKVNGWLESAGRDERLPRLTEKSLDEFVVFPLSGNYYRIQQNASACGIFQQGMSAWGTNFGVLAGDSILAFEGRAQVSFMAQLGAYGLVMKTVGGIIQLGSGVFDSIAVVSEKIAIQVENALIEMGKRLIKLAKVVGKRFLGGWVSLALLIKDLAEHGLAVITDVVDDVKRCIEIIDKCFELKDEVEAWAQTQADRLKALKEIADAVKQLPSVGLGTSLTDVPTLNLGPVTEALGAITPDVGQSGEGNEAEAAVLDAGEATAGDSGYVHPSWAENCATPPLGMETVPWDPAFAQAKPDLLTGRLPVLPLPIPGESSREYYDAYEEWRQGVAGPLLPPPAATGKPKGE